MSEIRNQLKNQNLEAVLPASLAQVGGQVFPDEPSIQDQLDFAQIVRTWSSVHAPTYGNPIGSTSSTITKAGAAGEAEVDVVTATKSEVYRVQSIAMSNAGSNLIVAKILIGGCPIVMDFRANPNGTGVFPITNALYVDLNSPLKFAVISGTGTDATLLVNVIKVSQ